MNGDTSDTKNTVDRMTISLCCGADVQQLTVEKCSRLFHQRLRNIVETEIDRAHQRYPLLGEIHQASVDIGEIPLLQFEEEFCQRFSVEFQHCLDDHGVTCSERHPPVLANAREVTGLPVRQNDHGAAYSERYPPVLANAREVTDLPAQHNADADELTSFDRYLDLGYWPRPRAWIGENGADEWLIAERETDPDRWHALIARACLFPQRRRRLLRLLKQDTLAQCLPPDGPVSPFAMLIKALRYFQRNPQQRFPLAKVDLDAIEVSASGNEELLIALFSDTPPAPSIPWLRAIWTRLAVRTWLESRLPVRQVELLQQLLAHADEQESASALRRREPEQLHSQDRSIPTENPQRTDGQNIAYRSTALDLTTIPVANAGLVLLWPLLADLFARLGLWEEDHFVSAQAQINAACWLDLTIWADDCAREWRMALTKWLCGLPLESEIDWQAPDQAQAEQLQQWLPSLALQLPAWRILKEVDIRTLFLQRPGYLEHADPAGSAMTLVVQPEPFDVLITDWPWPVDTIMLPWLEQPLTVHWQLFST